MTTTTTTADAQVRAAVSQYQAVEYRRQQLQLHEDRLHRAVGQLTPDQFAAYADITTELDDQRAGRA